MHAMLISRALNRFGFLFPPLVFNISDLLLSLSFDALVFFLLLLRSNDILPNAEDVSHALWMADLISSGQHLNLGWV